MWQGPGLCGHHEPVQATVSHARGAIRGPLQSLTPVNYYTQRRTLQLDDLHIGWTHSRQKWLRLDHYIQYFKVSKGGRH